MSRTPNGRAWRRRAIPIATIAFVVVLAFAVVALPRAGANFTSTTANGPSAIAGDTLDAVTNLAADRGTPGQVDLTWTPSVDTYATGYRVYSSPTSGSGYVLVDTVLGQSSSAYTDVLCTASAPVFESGTTNSEDPASSPISVSVPAGTAVDDVLIATIVIDQAAPTPITPSGWTLLDAGDGGVEADVSAAVWYRVADGTEPASYSFAWTGGSVLDAVASISRYSGVDPSAPIDAIGFATGSSTTPTAPAVTTTSTDTRVVRIFGADDAAAAVTHPAGHVGRWALWTGALGIGMVTGAVADTTQSAAGDSGTAAFTISAAQSWRAVTVALAPACDGAIRYYVLETFHQGWSSAFSAED